MFLFLETNLLGSARFCTTIKASNLDAMYHISVHCLGVKQLTLETKVRMFSVAKFVDQRGDLFQSIVLYFFGHLLLGGIDRSNMFVDALKL